MGRTLVSDSLVYRYDCYVQAPARAGRPREARIVLEKMLTHANHLELFSEEIGPSGEQLGYFPQAFGHGPR